MTEFDKTQSGPFEVKVVDGRKVVVIPPLSKEKLDEIHNKVVQGQQGLTGWALDHAIHVGKDQG